MQREQCQKKHGGMKKKGILGERKRQQLSKGQDRLTKLSKESGCSGLEMNAFDLSTWKAGAKGCRYLGQPRLHSEILSKEKEENVCTGV